MRRVLGENDAYRTVIWGFSFLQPKLIFRATNRVEAWILLPATLPLNLLKKYSHQEGGRGDIRQQEPPKTASSKRPDLLAKAIQAISMV